MTKTDLPDLVGRIIRWSSPRAEGDRHYGGTTFIRRTTIDNRLLVAGVIDGDALTVYGESDIVMHSEGKHPIEYEVTNAGQGCIFNKTEFVENVIAHDLFTTRADALHGLEHIREVCIANGIEVSREPASGVEVITGNGNVSQFYFKEII